MESGQKKSYALVIPSIIIAIAIIIGAWMIVESNKAEGIKRQKIFEQERQDAYDKERRDRLNESLDRTNRLLGR